MYKAVSWFRSSIGWMTSWPAPVGTSSLASAVLSQVASHWLCFQVDWAVMQGNHSTYVKAGATCKHFAAYSLEQWQGISRFAFDAVLDPRCAPLARRAALLHGAHDAPVL